MIRLRLQGERALFPRPNFRRDRVSFPVLPVVTANFMLERLHPPWDFFYQIDRIVVLSEVKFDTVRMTRDGSEWRARILRDVDYVVDASIQPAPGASPRETDYYRACLASQIDSGAGGDLFLGHPEFSASIAMIDPTAPLARSFYEGTEVDFGWLPWRKDREKVYRYLDAIAVNGIIEVPSTQTSQIWT